MKNMALKSREKVICSYIYYSKPNVVACLGAACLIDVRAATGQGACGFGVEVPRGHEKFVPH
jgi:hypothetical protein